MILRPDGGGEAGNTGCRRSWGNPAIWPGMSTLRLVPPLAPARIALCGLWISDNASAALEL